MRKAIRITKDNKGRLEHDYNMDKGDLDLSSGMYLISDFGSDKAHVILTPARYRMYYTEGKELNNGYVEVTPIKREQPAT